ncbi:H/ACA ribonucleoprotein complex non-core subunit NAF1-like [Aristolochia californica]|uniref:H/ACA ribonucleoprotein complex non-core subunit NAF1-like n=1 Tax=Aristolochia californica TaxID=171875 RepID=UPI0035DB4998
MVRSLSKPSVQTDPLDLFIDFPSFSNESFPDFDSIEGWILDQDPDSMPTGEPLSGDTDAVSNFGFSKTDDLVEQNEVGVVHECRLKTSVGLNEPVEIAAGRLSGETACEISAGTQGADGPSVESPVELELRASIGLSGDSIVEEMEKVSLVGNGPFGNSVTQCEESSKEDLGVSQMSVTVNAEMSESNGGTCKNSLVTSTGKIEKEDNNEIKVENVSDRSDSGTSESDSDEESSSSSSSEETDDDGDNKVEEDTGADDDIEVEEGEIRVADREETVFRSEDEEEAPVQGPIKSKNEVEILPPVPAVTVVLEQYHRTLPVGVVLSIVGAKVIVEGLEKHNPLNEGSILWITETRLPLGLVDEIFGPVKNPYYLVRYNSEEDVPPGIHEGSAISFVVDFADHVLNDKNLYRKGYDASGENDEEISDEIEFSDDEKEAEYKRMKRTTKRGKADKKYGSQETEGRKRAQVKNEMRKDFQPAKNESWKDFQPAATPSPVGIVKPQKVDAEVAVVQGQPQIPRAPALFGSGSCGCLHGAQTVVPFGGPNQAMQFSGVWPNMVPSQSIPMGSLSNAIPFRGLPLPPQHHHYPDQHQHQMFAGFQDVPPFQQQFDPSQHGMAPFGSMNLSMGLPSMNWPRPLGLDNVNQGPMMPRFNGQLQPQTLQGSFSATQQYNPGMSSGRGNKPFHRGRGGHHFRGRGRRQNG